MRNVSPIVLIMRTLGHYLKTMRVYEFERDVLQLCNPAWPHLSAPPNPGVVLLLLRISNTVDNVAQRSLGHLNR